MTSAASLHRSCVTRTGLALSIRALTQDEAARYKWVALLPYTWTSARYAQLLSRSWTSLAAAVALTAPVVWRWPCLWPSLLLAPLLLPACCFQPCLRFLLWAVNARQLADYNRFGEFWTSNGNCMYGAFTDQHKLAGTIASSHVAQGLCEMQRLGVQEEFRGQGVGEALCRHLMSQCAAKGYHRMQLGPSQLQQPAVRLYEKLGFVRTSRFRTFRLPGVDIYLYAIELSECANW